MSDDRPGGLRFRFAPSDPAPYVGAGQVVELSGWVMHTAAAVRRVWLVADGVRHRVELGFARPAQVERLRRSGLRVPDGIGARVALPVPQQVAERSVELRLRAELAGGSVVEKELPPLRLLPGVELRPTPVSWPGTGPRVAVVMATYQPRREFLVTQVASIRAQDHPNWVCIVCDDGSPPESWSVIRDVIGEDARFVLVENPVNVGFYRNFERALARVPADAEFVALCDQDDVWDQDKLSALLREFDDLDVQVAYSDMRLIDETGCPLADSFWDRARNRNQCHDLVALLQENTVSGAAAMARAGLVRERVLPFPPGPAFHDHWLAVVGLAHGRIAFVDRPLYSYRQHTAAVIGHREHEVGRRPPSIARLVLAAWMPRCRLPREQERWLDSVVGGEIPRVARMASVLLLRSGDRLRPDLAQTLRRVAALDKSLRGLHVLRRAPNRTRELTLHAHDRMTAATVRHRLRRRRRLKPR